MLARTAHSRFPRVGLRTEGPSGARILLRIAAAVGIAACTSAAVAVTADAVQPGATGTSAATPASPRSIVVTTLGSSGPGSLRAAISSADVSSPGQSTVIGFAVHGTITLASNLPAISRDVTIDATSAPTYISGGPPVVAIDCNAHAGLLFAAGSAGSQLLGVAVDNASGSGVTLNASSITLDDNYIGLGLTGGASGNHGDGVYVSASSSRNLIGLNSSGASGVVANVISGNTGSGIVLSGSSGNTVVSNRIGTNAAGTSAIANGGDGISITRRSNGNEIGGTDFVDTATGQANDPTGDKGTVTPVFVVPPLGNLISGNSRNGVLIDTGSRGNVLNGNFVGTTADGDGAIGNGGNGVWINRANDNSLAGCKFTTNPFVYYNVVSGNGRNGLRITSSRRTLVPGGFLWRRRRQHRNRQQSAERHSGRRILGEYQGGRGYSAWERVIRQRSQRHSGERHRERIRQLSTPLGACWPSRAPLPTAMTACLSRRREAATCLGRACFPGMRRTVLS